MYMLAFFENILAFLAALPTFVNNYLPNVSGSRDSVVGAATGYRLDDQAVVG
jgi:hypothetical protein